MLKKILVATDFCSSSTDALKTAEVLASTFGSKIILIHVIPKVLGSPMNLRTLKTDRRNRMRKLRARLDGKGIRTGNSVVAVGSPFDQIIQTSELLDVNLIVAGSGSNAHSGRGWPGYVTERLVRKASKPVWVVKAGTPPKFKRILCAVDFSDPSARALTSAIHLARAYQAELTVLTVTQDLADLYVTSTKITRDAQSKFHQRMEKRFETFLKQFDFTDVRWTKAKQKGVPERKVLKFAKKSEADLLVMGSVGRTGLARIVLGTVAARILREMPCSLITVKAEDAVRLELEAEIADIEKQWACGQELLKKGLPGDAIHQFQNCLIKDKFHVPALQGMADAHARMGHREEAEKCSRAADCIREQRRQDRVEAAIRGEHALWRKI